MENLYDLQQPPAPKHSGLGIASFVMAMINIALFFIMIILFIATSGDLISMVEQSGGQVNADEIIGKAPSLMITGLFFIFILIVSLIGGILGIVGLFQKNRKKLFAVLGTVFNLAGWALFLLLLTISMIATSSVSTV